MNDAMTIALIKSYVKKYANNTQNGIALKPLTFTGAVNATYDGSKPVEVVIPQGGGAIGSDSVGKKWLFIGDSITEHNFRATKNYDQFLAEWLGIVSVNRGMSSTGVTHSLTSSPTWLEDLPNYPADVDYISVMGALNDRHTELGAWGDRGTDTVYGGVWNYFNNLIAKYPNKPIIYITSTPREYSYGVDGQYTAWVDAFIKTAHNFSIPVLDLYRESGLRPWNATNNKTYFSCNSAPNGDGVHPNALGQELMAKKILDFAKAHLLGLDGVDSGDSGGDTSGITVTIDTGAWEVGAIMNTTGNVSQNNRVRTVGGVDVTGYSEISVTFDPVVYKVAIFYYTLEPSSNTSTPYYRAYDTTGKITITGDAYPTGGVTHIRIVLARVDSAEMTADEASAVTVTGVMN